MPTRFETEDTRTKSTAQLTTLTNTNNYTFRPKKTQWALKMSRKNYMHSIQAFKATGSEA